MVSLSKRKIGSIESPFITKILNELTELRGRVDKLEALLSESKDGKLTESENEEFEDIRVRSISTIAAIGMARRAIYGYSMLLTEMGLPKKQAELVRALEQAISMAMRLMQAIKMLELAMASSPAGAVIYGAMAGGTLIAGIIYGMRTGGG